jgi:hypothetical protein
MNTPGSSGPWPSRPIDPRDGRAYLRSVDIRPALDADDPMSKALDGICGIDVTHD